MQNKYSYNILYVDDEQTNLLVFKKFFKHYYSKIYIAQSGEEALTYLQQNDINLIITDQKMPKMNGLEFMQQAKKTSPNIPIILLTAYENNELLKQAINEVGIARYINKPYKPIELLGIIEQVLENYQLKIDKDNLRKDLAESEERYSKLIGAALDAIITINAQQKIILVNEAAEKLFGYTTDNVIYKTIDLLIPNIGWYFILDNLSEEDEGKFIMTDAGEIVHGINIKGKEIPIELSVTSLQIKKEKYFNIIIKDVSQRVEMENALKKKDDIFRGMFNSTSDIFIRTNQNNLIEVITPSVKNHLGYFPSNLIGEHISIIFKFKEEIKDFIDLIKKLESVRNYNIPLVTKKGDTKIFSVNSNVVYNSIGEFYCIDSSLRDVTEQVENQRQLYEFNEELEILVKERTHQLEQANAKLENAFQREKKVNKLKSHFVALASHQFRTPLTVIKSNVSLMEMYLEPFDLSSSVYDKFKKISSRIHGEIALMTELMDDVLILEKIDGGYENLYKKSIDLASLCNDIIHKINVTQPEHRKMLLEIKGTVRPYALDKKLIDHAISNLISNAYKYSEGMPAPNCMIEFTSNAIKISIRDYGIGIPKEDIHHLFEPFYRANNTTSIKGTGLGTTIAKEYIELNGGQLKLESEIGKGTLVTIHFT